MADKIHHCDDPTCPFEGAPVVSEYTALQALEDGVLVDLTSLKLCFLPNGRKNGIGMIHRTEDCPPEAQYGPITKRCRPISRMTRTFWTRFEQGYGYRPADEPETEPRVMELALLVTDLRNRLSDTRDSEGDGYLIIVPGREGSPVQEITWLMANEEGNFTLMLPEDY